MRRERLHRDSDHVQRNVVAFSVRRALQAWLHDRTRRQRSVYAQVGVGPFLEAKPFHVLAARNPVSRKVGCARLDSASMLVHVAATDLDEEHVGNALAAQVAPAIASSRKWVDGVHDDVLASSKARADDLVCDGITGGSIDSNVLRPDETMPDSTASSRTKLEGILRASSTAQVVFPTPGSPPSTTSTIRQVVLVWGAFAALETSGPGRHNRETAAPGWADVRRSLVSRGRATAFAFRACLSAGGCRFVGLHSVGGDFRCAGSAPIHAQGRWLIVVLSAVGWQAWGSFDSFIPLSSRLLGVARPGGSRSRSRKGNPSAVSLILTPSDQC